MCKIFHKENGTNIPQSIWQLFWLRLKLKLRERDLHACKIPKNRSTFGANIPYSEKTVLPLQNSKTQIDHQFQFLHWILHSIG